MTTTPVLPVPFVPQTDIYDAPSASEAWTVRFPPGMVEEINREANRTDTSFSHVVRQALKWHFEELAEEWTESADDRETTKAVRLRPVGDGPLESFEVLVDGYPVPNLVAHEMEGHQFTLTLDSRFGTQFLERDELWRWAWFLAQAMAVSAGYTCHGPDSRRINPHGPSEEAAQAAG